MSETEIGLGLGHIELILDNLLSRNPLGDVQAEASQRPYLKEMLLKVTGETAPDVPVSTLKPFSRRGNQILYNGEPFRFTGANMRGLAWYGDILPYATANDVNIQLDGAKAIGMKVIRFYAAHHTRTVKQSIPRVKAILDALHARNMFGIVVLTDGAQSGFYVADTPQNRGGNPDRYTQRWVDGGFRENYKLFVDEFTTAIGNHPALFAYCICNEYTATIFPLTIPMADNLLKLHAEISTLIATNAPQKFVSTGLESCWQGFVNHAYDGGQYARKLYALPNIHYGTCHTYMSDGNPLGSTHEHIKRELEISGHPMIIEETNTRHEVANADWLNSLVNATLPRFSGYLQWNMSFPYCRDTGDADGLYNCDKDQHLGARWHNHVGYWRSLAERLL